MALSVLLSCLLLWSFSSYTTAFDITKILNQYSDYAVFNQLLSKTHVAGEINKRKSVTVLVVPNGAMSGVTSLKDDSLSTIMKIHVVLDYYDSAKIKKLKNGTKVTTLYQTTGSADQEEGFLKVQKDNNDIKLGSAVSGSQISARVNKVVTSVASDVSVIEISSPILLTGLDDSKTSGKSSSPSSSPSPSSKDKSSSSSPDSSPAPSPSKSKKHKHKHTPAPSPSDSSPSDSPDSNSDDSPAPAPSHKKKHKHKHAHSPAPSDADAPSDEDADADDADADDADADADADAEEEDEREADDDESSSSRNTVVSGGIVLASLFAIL